MLIHDQEVGKMAVLYNDLYLLPSPHTGATFQRMDIEPHS